MNQLFNRSVKALYPYWNKRLTVLLYHRVADIHGEAFAEYKPTVSAAPARFAAQMAFVRAHFNPITADALVKSLQGEITLPRRPLLVTFDDGYRDNFDVAFPILQRYGVPALFFLATDYIGEDRAFDWDLAAYAFHATVKTEARLPLTGLRHWSDRESKERVMYEWVRSMLRQPGQPRAEAVAALPAALGIRIPKGAFAHLCLGWDQVRQMLAAGMAFGSHTRSHRVLDRLQSEETRAEIGESRRRIQTETGRTVSAFAYPNGVFNPVLEAAAQQAGYQIAFSTHQGPVLFGRVQARPFAIARIPISQKDDQLRFLAKLAGLPRLKRSTHMRDQASVHQAAES